MSRASSFIIQKNTGKEASKFVLIVGLIEKEIFLSRKNEELANPDQSLLMGYYRDRKLPIGFLSSRYNLNCRIASDKHTRILHFNIDKVKPWDLSLSEAKALVAENRPDDQVWRYVVAWLELEEQVEITFPRSRST